MPEARETEEVDAVVGQLVQIAGKTAPFAEELAEARQASLHRVASNDDHARRRQHRQCRADEIPAHQALVGEARPGLAPARGSCEVFAAEALPILCRGIGDPQRERRIAALGFRIDDLRHVFYLVGTGDLRMRSEDLLDQCRAGTRNADDQDDFAAEPVVQRRWRSFCKHALDLVHPFALSCGVPLHAAAARCIGDSEHVERLRIVPLVFQGFGVGEAQQLALTG